MMITMIPIKSEYVAIILFFLLKDVLGLSLVVCIPNLLVLASEVTDSCRIIFFGLPHP